MCIIDIILFWVCTPIELEITFKIASDYLLIIEDKTLLIHILSIWSGDLVDYIKC